MMFQELKVCSHYSIIPSLLFVYIKKINLFLHYKQWNMELVRCYFIAKIHKKKWDFEDLHIED